MNKNLISVILTGGKSSRMNFQNKSFLKLDNKFFIENIIANLEQKVSKIIINANNDIDKYQFLNLEIVTSFNPKTSTPVLLTPSIAILTENLAAAFGVIKFELRAS